MSATVRDSSRHIYPRWRSFRATASLGELSIPAHPSKRDLAALDLSLANGLVEWQDDPTLWKSLDLLGSVIVAGKISDFSYLVKMVQSNSSTPAVALEALTPVESESDISGPNELSPRSNLRLQSAIHKHRARLIEGPRDAIEWVELARAYTVAGVPVKAERCVLAALQLAPLNRYVLRSSARFFIHVGQHDRAHNLLERTPVTIGDAWLTASEIAIASSIGKTSKFIKSGRKLIERGAPASEVTELASALGSLEAEGGRDRVARRLLRQAVSGANENSIAQISWLNRSYLGDGVDISRVVPPLLHESSAWNSFYASDFLSARDHALSWLADQPFASAPAILSSFILCEVLGDYAAAREITEASLRANPDDPSLVNNLVVCLLEQNEIDAARMQSSKIKDVPADKLEEAVNKATKGKLSFRTGNVVEGRSLYIQAIDAALESGNKVIAARAAVTLAMEELKAKTQEVEHAIIRLRSFEEQQNEVEVMCLLNRFRHLLAQP